MIELGRPSRMGIIKFATGQGSYSTEKNFEDHVLDTAGNALDLRLRPGALGFQLQFRASTTARFRYSLIKGEVTQTSDGIFWTSKPNQPDGETGISVDGISPNDMLNVYVASSAASTVLEVRVWDGYM